MIIATHLQDFPMPTATPFSTTGSIKRFRKLLVRQRYYNVYMRTTRALTVLLVLLLPLSFCDAVSSKLLKVSFLDIGQGDSIYIEAPNGRQMIIDGGPKNNVQQVLTDELPFGDRSIDVLVVTNPDADHYSGFIDLLKNYDVGAVIESGTRTNTPTYSALQSAIAKNNTPHLLARKGMKIVLDKEDGVEFDVLFPDLDVSGWSRNDGSIMGVLVYGKTKIFFTGDGTTTTENAVMLRTDKEILKSNILKVGHHGSRTSTSDAFVQAVSPTWAVISDGQGNSYGHPHAETLATLTHNHVQILRTDQKGTIRFISDGTTFWLK
jgi:competence protein ComEC